jgi:hypothetical protein
MYQEWKGMLEKAGEVNSTKAYIKAYKAFLHGET